MKYRSHWLLALSLLALPLGATADSYLVKFKLDGLVAAPSLATPSQDEIMCQQEKIEVTEESVTRTVTVTEYKNVTETVMVERETQVPRKELYIKTPDKEAFISHSTNMNNQGKVGFTRYWWDGKIIKSGYATSNNTTNKTTLVAAPAGYSRGAKRGSNGGINYYSIIRNAHTVTVTEPQTVTRREPIEKEVEVQEVIQGEHKTGNYDWCIEQGYPTHP